VHGPVLRPDLGPERGLDWRLLRMPERSEEQGLVRVKEQSPEQTLFRATKQGLGRRSLPTPKRAPLRGPERMSLQEPEQGLQLALERRPDWGQEFPQPSGGWESGTDDVRSQMSEVRSQKCGSGGIITI
jgi:hypothetical protein